MGEDTTADAYLPGLFRLYIKAVDGVPVAWSKMANSYTVRFSHQKHVISGTIRVSNGNKGKTLEILVQLEQVAGTVSGYGENQPVIAVGEDVPVVGNRRSSRVSWAGHSLPRNHSFGVGYIQAAHKKLAVQLC